MKKIYKEPQTTYATYARMILEVRPGTNNGGEFPGGDVDAHKRDEYSPEEEERVDTLDAILW